MTRPSDRLSTAVRYRVKFYCPERGGVWSRTFWDESAAKGFATGKRLYAKSARVETIVGAESTRWQRTLGERT
jgi:hypothetical protein